MRGMKRKTRTREHKDLQSGQGGVIVKRVGINIYNPYIIQRYCSRTQSSSSVACY